VTSRGPSYVAPEIKVKLRRKNRLMRVGRLEEAGALSARLVGISHGAANVSSDTKELHVGRGCAATHCGRVHHQPAADPSITAEALNQHYASVSTDTGYERPPPKDSASRAPRQDK